MALVIKKTITSYQYAMDNLAGNIEIKSFIE